MGIHLEAFHSVDTRHIDWSKQLQKEVDVYNSGDVILT